MQKLFSPTRMPEGYVIADAIQLVHVDEIEKEKAIT